MAADPPSFEAPLLRVPYESLRRTARDRKAAVEALAAVAAELEAASGGGTAAPAGACAGPSPEAAAALMAAAASRLAKLKRKLDTASEAEAADSARCVARLRHLLESGGPVPPTGGGSKAADPGGGGGGGKKGGDHAHHHPPPDLASAPPAPPSTDPATSALAWSAPRLDRLIADDLLRRGRAGAAAALLAEGGGGGGEGGGAAPSPLAPLVDWGVWEGAAPALAGLADRDAGPALAWCAARAARLAKLRSPLEFTLRLQQCVELVRGGDGLGALAHARAHLAPWASPTGRGGPGAAGFLEELQRVAGLAAFCGRGAGGDGDGRGGGGGQASPPLPPPYARLLSPDRWADAAAALRRDVCRLAGAPVGRSPLEAALQAGLAALKPPPGAPPPTARDDPLAASPPLAALAAPLPHAKRLHSRLLCGLTGRLMDGDNPPAALPSGAVFSQAALAARAGPGGALTDPETGEGLRLADLRRVYIS